MPTEVKFEYECGEKVEIICNGCRGTVEGFLIDRDNVKWASVCWVMPDQSIKRDYFREADIRIVN